MQCDRLTQVVVALYSTASNVTALAASLYNDPNDNVTDEEILALVTAARRDLYAAERALRALKDTRLSRAVGIGRAAGRNLGHGTPTAIEDGPGVRLTLTTTEDSQASPGDVGNSHRAAA